MTRIISCQRGVLAMDFLFGLVITFSFLMVIVQFAMTLTSIEVAQYIVFATARTQTAAHETPGAAKVRANEKFDKLMGEDAFEYLNNGTSFEFRKENIGHVGILEYESQDPTKEPDMNYGVTAELVPKILDFSIPWLGSSLTSPGDTSELATSITSFLGRSPSQSECRDFNSDERRFRAGIVQSLSNDPVDQSPTSARYSNAPTLAYYPMEDNGC